MTSPPSGTTASVAKHFFEESLVQCQEEEVQEAVATSPQKRALPGLKIKIMRIIFGDSQPECGCLHSLGNGQTLLLTHPWWQVYQPVKAGQTEAQRGQGTSLRM